MRHLLVAFLPLILSVACTTGRERAPVIGTAYVGPAMLNLRQAISLNSNTAATVKHGERLEILQHRRSFVKVRTSTGLEGWTEERMLLTSEQLAQLQALEKQAKTLPSQGISTTYQLLNVHTEPDRQSPSFLRINEGEKMELIGHRLAPRISPKPPTRAAVPAPAPRKRKRNEDSSKRVPFPPPPPAPKLPDNWLELSRTRLELEPHVEPPRPVPMDDWSLVRTASGQSGWVLSSRLFMAIPDEVAQYAEGRRISSYFSLSDVHDGDQLKHNWLWTTIEKGARPYDFDSFRIFIWSLRRHRYETAYIERNLKGYYPVLVHPLELVKPLTKKGVPPEKISYPGFSVLVEKNDGRRYRRSYAFIVNIVRFAGEQAAEAPLAPDLRQPVIPISASAQPQAANQKSLYSRLKEHLNAWRKRWFAKK